MLKIRCVRVPLNTTRLTWLDCYSLFVLEFRCLREVKFDGGFVRILFYYLPSSDDLELVETDEIS